MLKKFLFLGVPLLLATGCTMTPELPTVAADIPETWSQQPATAEEATPLPDWRTFFPQPGLQTLIQQALENNRDLAMAFGRVKKAAALAGIASSNRWPGVQGNISHQASRTPGGLGQQPEASLTHRTDVGLTLTSFEIDLWGRLGSLEEAAWHRYLASEETARALRVVLIAQVADSFVAWREATERLHVAEALVANRQEWQKLTHQRGEMGLVSRSVTLEADAALHTAQGEVGEWQRQENASRHALALLLATPEELPTQWPALEDMAWETPLRPPLPSQLLLERPDILAAERQLRGANGDIGAARAAFFPRISLTAAGGTASGALSGLFQTGSGAWTFLPAVTIPIFELSRRQRELEAATAEQEILLNAYEKAIQQGFREVAEALTLQHILQQRHTALSQVAHARQQKNQQGEARWQVGLDGRLTVLETQREWLQARHQQLASHRQLLSGRILLFKTLGGGQ